MKYLLLLLAILLIGCQRPDTAAEIRSLERRVDSLRIVLRVRGDSLEEARSAILRQVELIEVYDSLLDHAALGVTIARQNMLIYEKPSDSLTADLNRIYGEITGKPRRNR